MDDDTQPTVPGLSVDSEGDGGARFALLEQGLILDGASERELSEAEIIEMRSGSGDLLLAATHHGFGYKATNEDRIALVESQWEDGFQAAYVVIDGMGGHQGGDVSAQILAEEVIRVQRTAEHELRAQRREFIVARIAETIDDLPSAALRNSVNEKIFAYLQQDREDLSLFDIPRVVIEIIQSDTCALVEPNPQKFEKIAEITHYIKKIEIPERIELAVGNTTERVRQLGYVRNPPDSCFIAALIRSHADGSKELDVKQVGDCKLFVCDGDSRVKFQSINESFVAQPDLGNPKVPLSELMTYSLYRNFVSNSINKRPVEFRRYRRSQLPVRLEDGDRVFIYSDGCDDILAPEEIIDTGRGLKPAALVRTILQMSEKRMRFVDSQLRSEMARRRPEEKRTAYPVVHQRLNEERVKAGRYVERYPDGTVGRYLKPPKCDNFAFCAITIGGAR